MEGITQPKVSENEDEVLDKNGKLESAGEIVRDLFQEIGRRAVEKIRENPFYKNFSDRNF